MQRWKHYSIGMGKAEDGEYIRLDDHQKEIDFLNAELQKQKAVVEAAVELWRNGWQSDDQRNLFLAIREAGLCFKEDENEKI